MPSSSFVTTNTESPFPLTELKSLMASAGTSPAGSHGGGNQRSGRNPIRMYQGTKRLRTEQADETLESTSQIVSGIVSSCPSENSDCIRRVRIGQSNGRSVTSTGRSRVKQLLFENGNSIRERSRIVGTADLP